MGGSFALRGCALPLWGSPLDEADGERRRGGWGLLPCSARSGGQWWGLQGVHQRARLASGATPQAPERAWKAARSEWGFIFKASLHPKFLRFHNVMKNLPRRRKEAPCPSICTKFSGEQRKCCAESGGADGCPAAWPGRPSPRGGRLNNASCVFNIVREPNRINISHPGD